ncbi:hypothetical protein Tco_1153050 [Tanacetum coccineum]
MHIDDVQVLDNVVCVDRNKFGYDNVDVNMDEVIADEDVDLAGNNVFVADKKLFLGDEDVEFCEKNYVVSEKRVLILKRDESGDIADMNKLSYI